ncbi:hypothetical protein pdam_00011435 [Pocillopora damicornis]|uniref:Gustatory receptor n=1 Tax=Pocillopora damicornis TaxID=46731 RepID=A0A3M6URK2_POCDA|nr:hypothetical protein pdam_00011435 [Pocillopora damicornis]
MEHHRLCEVVELADKMLASLLLGVVALYIPMLCISFYNSVIFREDMKLMALATTLSWCFVAAGILATVLFFGSKVNEKIHSFQSILQTMPVSTAEEAKVLLFLLDLQGEPKGLSIGGLLVITKSTSLAGAKVSPNECTVPLDNGMSYSNSEQQATVNEVSNLTGSPPEAKNVNEHLFKAISDIFRPILKLMKLFGIYYGDNTLKSLTDDSGRLSRRACFFVPERIYVSLMFCLWCLMGALNATITLIVSPVTRTRKSRFQHFVRGLIDNKSHATLEKVTVKSRNGIIAFFLVFASATVGSLMTKLKLDMNLANFKPLSESPVFAIVSVIFLIIAVGSWLLPVLLFCITCLILAELFDDLSKRMKQQSLHSTTVQLASFKVEHHQLCEVVELAAAMFSPLLLGMVSLYIPLICFNLYLAVHSPGKTEETKYLFMGNNFFWLIASVCVLTIIMLFGSKVSEGIHSFQKILRTVPVSKEDEGKLVMFMLDLQGDPQGFSIGGLVVITKSLSLTIAGVIISYFAVMLSLPN